MDDLLLDLLAALEAAAYLVDLIDKKAEQLRSVHAPSAATLDRLVEPWRAAFISSADHPSVLESYRVQLATRRSTL